MPNIFNFVFFFVSLLIFRYKYVLILISFLCASKWWITWRFSRYELENDQFNRFNGKFIPTYGLIISVYSPYTNTEIISNYKNLDFTHFCI